MDIVLDIYHRYKVQPVSPKLLENIEGITEMNIPYSRFTEKKPLGISGVARLKNADDFLEKVVEGHLVLCDEIILVDNMSEDKTKEICLNLQRKYPNKIKFFEYQYEVFPPIYNDNAKMQAEENSIHSLAYYYNWSFSKATYKYVMKLDDDNLLVEERAKELRNFVLTKQPQKYITYRGVNIFKRKKEI
jgi:cellulose synthase/poly-beta-1,6-N-acetylglucosamine synthase-like glycosyltransferase